MYRHMFAILASSLMLGAIHAATPAEMSITDGDLRRLPAAATKVISWWNSNDDCKEIRGKPIGVSNRTEVIFATTWPSSCGWGNTNGPVLLLVKSGKGYKSILDTTAVVVRLLPTTTNSFSDLEVIGSHLIFQYIYDGQQYVVRGQREYR
jgi:hypothetical protein